MSVTIRDAVIGDVPALLALVRELAEYERLPHTVIATEASLASSLFGERPAA
jgi:N-acetylglutamate synthase-like GNAT family acetyltransferase